MGGDQGLTGRGPAPFRTLQYDAQRSQNIVLSGAGRPPAECCACCKRVGPASTLLRWDRCTPPLILGIIARYLPHPAPCCVLLLQPAPP